LFESLLEAGLPALCIASVVPLLLKLPEGL